MKSPSRTEWPGLSHVPAVLHRGAIALGPNAQRVSTGAASALALVLNAAILISGAGPTMVRKDKPSVRTIIVVVIHILILCRVLLKIGTVRRDLCHVHELLAAGRRGALFIRPFVGRVCCYRPSSFRRSSSGSLAKFTAMRRASYGRNEYLFQGFPHPRRMAADGSALPRLKNEHRQPAALPARRRNVMSTPGRWKTTAPASSCATATGRRSPTCTTRKNLADARLPAC